MYTEYHMIRFLIIAKKYCFGYTTILILRQLIHVGRKCHYYWHL
jgi:hypothetical protein